MEQTFAIIKPDAVERNLIGKILERIEAEGFRITSMKRALLTLPIAEGFLPCSQGKTFLQRPDKVNVWRSRRTTGA
jgi:nucleoside diphosphate kinase (EC 2.7.4.6)